MSGQAGLRTINNNYVASGDGRDLLIYHDQSFRGGKMGMGLTSPHLPGRSRFDVKVSRPVGSSLGFNARNEGHTQHLNLSQSSVRAVSEKKTRIFEGGLSGLGATDLQFGHARSQPKLEAPKKPFSYVWAESSRKPAFDWDPVQQRSLFGDFGGGMSAQEFDLPSRRRAEAPSWNKRLPLQSYPGYSRTPLGGIWSQ